MYGNIKQSCSTASKTFFSSNSEFLNIVLNKPHKDFLNFCFVVVFCTFFNNIIENQIIKKLKSIGNQMKIPLKIVIKIR